VLNGQSVVGVAATFEPTAAAEVHAGEPPQNGITFTGYGLYRSTDLGATFTKVPINPWTTLKPGDVDVNTGRGGAYATYWNQGFYVNTGIYGGYNSYDTSRQTLLQGHFANGSTEGYEFSTFADTGYDFRFGNLSLGPVFSAHVHIDGYTERASFVPPRA